MRVQINIQGVEKCKIEVFIVSHCNDGNDIRFGDAFNIDSVIDDVVKRGKLVVGLATFVPWAMRDKKGDLIGFEIDVSNQLAKDMGGGRVCRQLGMELSPHCLRANLTSLLLAWCISQLVT